MALLNWLWSLVKAATSIVLPLVKEVPWRGIPNVLRWGLHFLIVVLILVGLWYLNHFFHLEKALRGSWPLLHQVWLPLLFLLVYLLSWLGYRLFRLLGPEHESSEFPDIDAAWKEALTALQQASVDLTELPLFLVLGRPAAGEEALFNAARLQLTVTQAPRRADAPLHVYAQREGLFVTCAGASLLGQQALLYAQTEQAPGPGPVSAVAELARQQDIQSILAKAQEQGRTPEQLTTEEQQALAKLAAPPPSPPLEAESRRRSFLQNQDLLDHYTERLQYLCRLLVRDRRPYCPINGILVLVPLQATANDLEASQTATLCQQDLAAAREILQIDCALFLLLCDLENCPGFPQFVAQLPQGQRNRYLGQRFPLRPDLDPRDRSDMLERGVEAIAQTLLPSFIYTLFRLEAPGTAEPTGHLPEALQQNAHLYQFLAQMRERRQRLGRLVRRSAELAEGEAALVAGCFLAGTGVDARTEQAFVPEVFQEMLGNQNCVSWTPQALAEEAAFLRFIRLGYTALGLLLTVLVCLGCYCWYF